jgi:O-antigen/teichoic acid export membrane protein
MGLTLGLDALCVIPLARLRQQERAIRFASVNFAGIATNIGLNLFFVWYCFTVYENGGNAITEAVFNPSIGVGYVFIANMVQALVKFVLIGGTYKHLTFQVNGTIIKQLVRYSSPLVLAGFAGIINETLDRRLIRNILEPSLGEKAALAQVGIYGAVYKLAVLITLFTQAFRYAAEPFFFSQYKNQDNKQVYATVTEWYTVVVSLLFLVVMLYLDVFKLLIRNSAYWEGLTIVPILLVANIFLGLIYNFSVWYKLTNKTHFGAIIAVVGAVITIGVNVWLIPIYGYKGAAIATLSSYAGMAVLSVTLGQRYFKVPYGFGRLALILGGAMLVWYISSLAQWDQEWQKLLANTGWLVAYVAGIVLLEFKSIKQLIGK